MKKLVDFKKSDRFLVLRLFYYDHIEPHIDSIRLIVLCACMMKVFKDVSSLVPNIIDAYYISTSSGYAKVVTCIWLCVVAYELLIIAFEPSYKYVKKKKTKEDLRTFINKHIKMLLLYTVLYIIGMILIKLVIEKNILAFLGSSLGLDVTANSGNFPHDLFSMINVIFSSLFGHIILTVAIIEITISLILKIRRDNQ